MYLIAGRRRSPGTPDQRSDAAADTQPAASEPALGLAGDGAFAEIADDAHDDEADMHDPDLLAELDALRLEMGLSAPPAAHTQKQPHAAAASDDTDSVEVTDADMNDPSLLAELSQVAGAAEQPARAVDQKLLGTLTARQDELKQAALAAKRQGHTERAREMLVLMKATKAAALAVEAGQPLPPDFAVPPPPAVENPSPQASIQPKSVVEPLTSIQPKAAAVSPASIQPKAAAAAPASMQPKAASSKAKAQPRAAAAEITMEDIYSDTNEIPDSIEAMAQQLREQTATATRLAAYFLKSGDKARALEFHRHRKQAAADAATLASLAGSQALPPVLHREVQWAEAAPQRRDIGAGQLQVAVGRVFSDGDLAATLGGESDFYVQWALTWPRDRGSRGHTRTLKFREFDQSGGDLHVQHAQSLDIVDRQNPRPLQRWAERAKLTVELFRYSGLLWGSQLIGRATLPLAGLRTRAEVSAVLPIEAVSGSLSRAGRPLPGGAVFVDVAVRLRLPLSNSPEVVSHAERWIYIDMRALSQPAEPASKSASKSEELAPESGEPASTSKEPVQQPEELARQPEEPAQSPKVPTENLEAPVSARRAQKQTEEPGAELTADDVESQLDMMDGVVSNAVLELELERIPARIAAAGGDGDEATYLRDLESAIRLRMSAVEALVGAGTLTIQAYMDSVGSEISQARQWALAAKRGGRKDLAARALQRMKAMQGEVREMAAAMDAADE